MRKLITILLLLFSVCLNAQFGDLQYISQGVNPPCPVPPCPTVPLTFTAIGQNTEYFPRYGSASRWNLEDGAKIIPDYTGVCPPDITDCHTAFYFRLIWLDVESNTTQGDYSKLWDNPDTGTPGDGRMRLRIKQALDNGQLFAFGIMQRFPGACGESFHDAEFYDNACGSYPEYVHDVMQSNPDEALRDFDAGGGWVEAANNPFWQTRFRAMHQAVMNWMDTAIITPTSGPRNGQAINVKNALAYVDIRGHGSYGEWHNCCEGGGYDNVYNWPGYSTANLVEGCAPDGETGAYPTTTSFKATIDAQVEVYNNYPCVIIINVLDCGHFDGLHHTRIPKEVARYALTKQNAHGLIGLRRDQWGDNATHYQNYLQNNPENVGGVDFNDTILSRYKYNYVTGEMPSYNCNNDGNVCRDGVNFGWLPEQARILHPTFVGNGNYGGNAPTSPESTMDSIRLFFRLNGPRILPINGEMTATLQAGAQFNVTLNWENRGNSVIHRAWTTQILVKNSGGTTVFTGTTAFQVKGFQLTGGTPQQVSTNMTLPGGVTPGTGYNIYVRLVDPLNYAQPFYLGITTARESDGSYLIRSNVTVVAGP